MVKKRSQPPKPPKGLSEPEAAYRHEGEEAGMPSDAWIARNKDALNASIREAQAQIARGEYYTLEETMARVRATIKRVAKKP